MKPPSGNPDAGSNGRPFTAGHDPRRNPGGKPRGHSAFRKLCRSYTQHALDALAAALENDGERVAAAKVLLEFGWGKPEAMSKTLDAARKGATIPTPEEAAAAAARLRALRESH